MADTSHLIEQLFINSKRFLAVLKTQSAFTYLAGRQGTFKFFLKNN